MQFHIAKKHLTSPF